MRIRPIMLIAATTAAIAAAGGVASAATGTSQPTAKAHAKAHGKPSAAPAAKAHGGNVTAVRVASTPTAFSVTSTRTTPIGAGAVAGILASCLGSDASNYHAVIAVRSSVAAQDTDGVVVAVNAAHQYVQCESKGDKGSSMSMPATFINDRLWGTGHLIEFFDSLGEPADGGQFLQLGAGHYTSDVAKVTISYGDNATEYPAVMAGGAFVYSAAITSPGGNAATATPYIHAYNAAGKEIYNQVTEPTAKP
ncbi:hypothetical protein [Streptacidiphilus sp. MAP5-3]|uniref:hypothetical protein n=2 Tax=Streptacidiphilus TaxID=228398 RepID=UPI0035172A89